MQVKVGQFTKSTTAGATTQTVSGVGFTPKVVIFYGTSSPASYASRNFQIFYGFDNAVGKYSISIASEDAQGTSNCGTSQGSSYSIRFVAVDATTPVKAYISSFTADGFNLTYDANDTNGHTIYYMAIAGSEISTKIGTVTLNSSTGNQSFTGVGFKPDGIIIAGGINTSASESDATDAKMMLGCACRADNSMGCIVGTSDDAQGTSDTYDSQRTDLFGRMLNSSTGADQQVFTINSFDADGFTVNKSVSDISRIYGYLAIKGVKIKIGAQNSRTSTGSQSTTGVGFKPKALITWSWALVADTLVNTDLVFCISGSDGSTDNGYGARDVDAQATTICWANRNDSKLLVNNGGTAADSEMDVTSFDNDGFTLNYTSAASGAWQFLYIAIGEDAQSPINSGTVGVCMY